MKRLFRSLLPVLFIVGTVLSVVGCREHTLIQNSVLSGKDSINSKVFTLHTLTRTYEDDSITTSTTFSGLPTYQPVGYIGDNNTFFGSTSAAVFFQVIPFTSTGTLDFSAGSAYHVDSVALVLPYGGFTWGDTNNSYNQTYNVYQMATAIQFDSSYYPSFTVDTTGALLGSVTINTSSIKDSVSLNGYNYAPHLRVTLDTNKLQTLLYNYRSWSTDATTFLANFYGVCVVPVAPASGQNIKALPYYRLDDGTGATAFYANAGIYIYYTYAGTRDSEMVYFYPGSCAHFDRILRMRPGAGTGTNVTSLMAEGYNGPSGIVALQNQPGAAVDVKIYGIRSIPRTAGSPIINRAQLTFTILPTYPGLSIDTSLFPPPKLYVTGVVTVNGHDSLYDVADRYPITSVTPVAAMDGYIHNMSVYGGYAQTYTINLPRELQSAMAANLDTIHLRVNGTSNFYGAYQVIMAGGNYSGTVGAGDTTRNAKMTVVYSTLK